jgi:hypothetical protein
VSATFNVGMKSITIEPSDSEKVGSAELFQPPETSVIFANLLKPQNFVIPAEAGTQSFVHSNTTNDWAPACAGVTVILDDVLAKLQYWRGFQALPKRYRNFKDFLFS